MGVYHVWLQIGPRLFRPMYMKVDQVNNIDDQTQGRGLPKGSSIVTTMDDGERVRCMDILIEYNVPIRG